MKKLMIWGPLALFLFFVGIAAYQLTQPKDDNVHSAMIGKPVPAFELPDRDGNAVTEAIFRSGEPKLLKLVAVDDAGNLINPLIVEGQIHGGLAQGIGQAMIEEAVYNADGQLVTGSFMDYAMPRATDFPRFELSATVTPTPVNPLGAKGVGEAGTLGSTPCIVAAAVDALSLLGVKHIDMSLKPEKLWRLIQGGQA